MQRTGHHRMHTPPSFCQYLRKSNQPKVYKLLLFCLLLKGVECFQDLLQSRNHGRSRQQARVQPKHISPRTISVRAFVSHNHSAISSSINVQPHTFIFYRSTKATLASIGNRSKALCEESKKPKHDLVPANSDKLLEQKSGANRS